MDPIEQILTQGQIGKSGPSPSPQFQAFEQGVQNSLSARRLNLEEQQQQFHQNERSQLLPFEIAQAKQNMEMKSLSLQTQWEQRQAMLNGAKGAADAFSTMSAMAREDEDPTRVAAVAADFLAANPMLANSPPAKALQDFSQNYASAKLRKDGIDATLKAREDATQQRRDAAESKVELDKMKIGNLVDRPKFAKQQEWQTWTEMQQKADEAQDPEQKTALQDAANLYGKFTKIIDEKGKAIGREAYVARGLNKLIQQMDESKDYDSFTPTQKRAKALNVLNKEYDSIESSSKTKTPSVSAPAKPEAKQSPAPVLQYIPGKGFVKPTAATSSAPSAAQSPVADSPAPAAIAPSQPAAKTNVPAAEPVIAPVVTNQGTSFSDNDLMEAGKYLDSIGWTEDEVMRVLDDAEKNPKGTGAETVRKALNLRNAKAR